MNNLEPVNSRNMNLTPRAKIGDVVIVEKHTHDWRRFERDDDAIPLWTDCLTCNARKVKETLRGTYNEYQWKLPKEERDHNKQVQYY